MKWWVLLVERNRIGNVVEIQTKFRPKPKTMKKLFLRIVRLLEDHKQIDADHRLQLKGLAKVNDQCREQQHLNHRLRPIQEQVNILLMVLVFIKFITIQFLTDFKCEDEGFYPHPRDCKKYFWCLDSGPSNLGIVAHQFTCPSGLVFNKITDSCDYTRNVQCTSKLSATTTTTTK